MAEQLTALSIMQDAPVIPVIVLRDVNHAVSMAKALVAGGIRVLEVTLRTPQGLASIEAIAKSVPEAIVGAGTVRNAADARAAAAAGARFAVSPGYTTSVGEACREARLPLLPGVATSSEIMQAQQDGFNELKFFPALQSGGSAMLKCAATTVTVRGGALQTEGSGAITTVNARGGTLKLHSTGTITTLNASDGAVIDFSGSNAARTVSTLAISGPCRIITAPGVTFTAITFTANVPLEIRAALLGLAA